MRDLGRRLLIGIAAGVAGVMAIGYAFIFGGIATPVRGDRAILDVPAVGETAAAILDDGLPVFVVNDPITGIAVLDARVRRPGSTIGVLVAWCPPGRTFTDPASGSVYTPDGELISGPSTTGLVAFTIRPVGVDKASQVIVGSDTTVQDRARSRRANSPAVCPSGAWVVHDPQPDEIFDPSVAADQEPPGWIWLEGSVAVADGGVRLCDKESRDCDRHAEAVGIDPATLTGNPISGRFIGRVRDGALEGLTHVPDPAEAS
ncbi:MAG: hypothetical protein ACT4OQ_09170 [Chloroflexota bacterium]